MEKITYENITDTLLKRFPEYKESEYYDEDSTELNYVMIGNFSLFLSERIEKFSESDEFIQRVFQFVNEAYNDPSATNPAKSSMSGSDSVRNLLRVAIFENLGGTKKGIALAKKYLKDIANDDFEVVINWRPTKEDKIMVGNWLKELGKTNQNNQKKK